MTTILTPASSIEQAKMLLAQCKADSRYFEEAVEKARDELMVRPQQTWTDQTPARHFALMKDFCPTLFVFRSAGYQRLDIFSRFFGSHYIQNRVPDIHMQGYRLYKYGWGHRFLNSILGRGFGKTTAFVLVPTLHGICYFDLYGWTHRQVNRMTGHPFQVICSQSEDHSKDLITFIKTELDFNELLKGAFSPPGQTSLHGKGHGFRWNSDDIVMTNYARVIALGRGSQIRGKRHLYFRPTIIYCDDLEGERNTTNINIIRDTRVWFNNAVRKSLYDSPQYKGRIWTVGTVVHIHCLVNHIRNKMSAFKTIFLPAMIQNDVTGKWESTWESEKPVKELLKERDEAERDGWLTGWLQETLNQPMSEGDRVFNPRKFKVWHGEYGYNPQFKRSFLEIEYTENMDQERTPVKQVLPINTYLGVDLASSDTKDRDFNVIMVVGVDNNNNCFLIDHWRYRTSIPTMVVDKIFDMAAQYHPLLTVIETVAYQNTLFALVREEQKVRNQWFRLKGEKHNAQIDKVERIASGLQPRFNAGTFHFRDFGMVDIRREMSEFPQSDHDDTLDAIWLALAYSRRCDLKEFQSSRFYEVDTDHYRAPRPKTSSVLTRA